jgi:hypothetical protein
VINSRHISQKAAQGFERRIYRLKNRSRKDGVMKKTSFVSRLVAARIVVLVIFVLLVAGALAAQQSGKNRGTVAVASDPASGAGSPSSTSSTKPEERPSDNEPLTLKSRFTDYRQSTFTPMAIVFPSVTAGYNQLRNYPREWQQGGEGYGKRLGSAYGSSVLDNTISFGIAALDREDPRYVRSSYPKKQIFKRAGYAIAHTFVSHRENGGHTPALSRFAGAYGAGFIANEWYPDRRSTVHNAVYLGSFNFASDVAFNLLREFIRPHFVWGPGKEKKATGNRQ